MYWPQMLHDASRHGVRARAGQCPGRQAGMVTWLLKCHPDMIGKQVESWDVPSDGIDHDEG